MRIVILQAETVNIIPTSYNGTSNNDVIML